jgi:hypothetical protein
MRYKIVYTEFPVKECSGLVTETEEGSRDYIIAINSTVSRIRQHHALGHELAHIFHDDLFRNADIRQIEDEAEMCAWAFYRLYRDGKIQPPYSIEGL